MKRLVLIGFFVLGSLLCYSQSSFGIIGGINNSSLSDGFLKKVAMDKAFSFHLGGVYQYNFNKNIAFRPKLVISFQGDRKEGSGGSSSISGTSVDYKLTYINAPLNFKFFSKPHLILGPQVGYLIGTKKGERDFGAIDNKFDVGLSFGFGYDFNKFFVEFNMYQGLTKLMEFDLSPNIYNPYGDGVTNTVLQLSVGYFFR